MKSMSELMERVVAMLSSYDSFIRFHFILVPHTPTS